MPATYTSRIRALQQEYNTNPESWGGELNTGALQRLDDAFAITEITVGAEVTLTSQNALADQSRSLVLICSGAGGFAVIHPAVDKPYLVINDCSADITMKPSGGTAATIRAGTQVWYHTNEAGTVGYVADMPLNKIKVPAASVDMNSQNLTSLADAVAGTDGTNKAQVEALIAAAATINLPVPTGNAGKFLTTDGTNSSWSNEFTDILLKDYGEEVNAIGSIGGGTQDIDLTLGNVVTGTVDTSTTTFTFSNPTAAGDACSFTLILTNGGSQTVNWPASVDWAGATAPTLTAAGVDVLTFTTLDGGTTWLGFAAGLDMS